MDQSHAQLLSCRGETNGRYFWGENTCHFNSLAPRRTGYILKKWILNVVLVIGIFKSTQDKALRWVPRDLTDGKSTLVQVMAWCRQATSHYLSQCWPRSLSPYWGGWGCEVSCGGHHRPRGKTTTGSALDGAVFDIAQILAYLVHNMSRSQLYLGFGHFGWLPSFFGQ